MAAATKVDFFFVLAILSLFCVGAHASKGCTFKSLYKQYGNSIFSSSLATIIGTIDGQQQPSFIHGVNNTVIEETRPDTGDFFCST